MTHDTASDRKPRIAMMGEFSAAKSTLCNFLLGQSALPEKVTATRLPPVWMTFGNAEPALVSFDGQEQTFLLQDIEETSLDDTRFIRLQFEADILQECDLLDLPGISDPNMSSEVWERMIAEVDAVLWCTHATQSWRQSESGVWKTFPEHIRQNSLLLITKFDKIVGETDRQRVLRRVTHEAGSEFGGVFPISLLQAMHSQPGSDEYQASGVSEFLETLHQITGRSYGTASSAQTKQPTPDGAEIGEITQRPTLANAPIQLKTPDGDATAEPATDAQQFSGAGIRPRRVIPTGAARTARPANKNSQVQIPRSAVSLEF